MRRAQDKHTSFTIGRMPYSQTNLYGATVDRVLSVWRDKYPLFPLPFRRQRVLRLNPTSSLSSLLINQSISFTTQETSNASPQPNDPSINITTNPALDVLSRHPILNLPHPNSPSVQRLLPLRPHQIPNLPNPATPNHLRASKASKRDPPPAKIQLHNLPQILLFSHPAP